MTTSELTRRPLALLPAVQAKEDQLAHALELERLLEDRLASSSRRYRCGTALFRSDLPRAGGLNVLRVDSGVEPLEPQALMQFVDAIQRGLPQLSVRVVDDERAAQLRPAFTSARWVSTTMAVMAPRRRPDRPVDVSTVQEVELGQLDHARATTLRRAHRDLDSADDLLVAGGLPAEGFDLRCFASMLGSEVAAYAVARVCGEVAKLTEVDALVRAQGSGLGRSVIYGAVMALREEGVRLVVVETLDDVWPKWIYQRLGFEAVGHTHRLVRPWG